MKFLKKTKRVFFLFVFTDLNFILFNGKQNHSSVPSLNVKGKKSGFHGLTRYNWNLEEYFSVASSFNAAPGQKLL